MKELLLYLIVFWGIFNPMHPSTIDISGLLLPEEIALKNEKTITPMEALDMIKKNYAVDFVKIYRENSREEYYYKSTIADYYLVYEGEVGVLKNYLIHLYEFVIDEEDMGVGHTVTYGWYTINKENGEIIEEINYYEELLW